MSSWYRSETVSILFAYSAAGIFWGAFAASAPAFQVRSELDAAGFGLLLLTMTSGAIPSMVIFGWFVERIARWALPRCLLAFAAAAVVLGLADSFTALVLSFFLVGAASGALDIALNMRVSTIERSRHTRLFNRAHAMFPLAILVASAVAGVARDAEVGPAAIFACVGAVMAVAAVLEAGTTKTASAVSTGSEGHSERRAQVPALLLLLGLLAALGAFQEMSAQSWAAIFVETSLMGSATVGGLAPAAFMLGLSVGRFVAHALEHRLAPLTVVALAASIGVPAFLLIAASEAWPMALVGFALAGIAVGPVEPNVFRAVTERSDDGSRGSTLSVVTTIAYVGYLTSPPVLGGVAETFGWPGLWMLAAAFAASVTILGVILMLWLERSDQNKTKR